MRRRDVMIRLDRETVREADALLVRARERRPGLSRAALVNEFLARAVRDRRYLRAVGAV